MLPTTWSSSVISPPSLSAIHQVLHPVKDYMPEDDMHIIDSHAEYEDDPSKAPDEQQLKFLTYEMEVRDPRTKKTTRFYKAVCLLRVIRIPEAIKQSTTFMEQQGELLAGMYEQGYNLLTVIANMIDPPLGLMYIYGTQAASIHSIDEAKKKAYHAFKAYVSGMTALFATVEMRSLTMKEAEWLREKMYTMDYMSVIRGIPKATQAAEDAGNKGMGGNNLNPDSEGTLEKIIRGMSSHEYIIEIISTPVPKKTISQWLRRSQDDMTVWNSQLSGQESVSANISMPMMFMANTSSANGWSKGFSDSTSHSTSYGESFSTSHGQSVGESLSRTVGQTVGHSQGVSASSSVSHGLSHSTGVTQGTTVGHTVGQTVGQTTGVSQGISQNVSHGTSAGASYNEGVSQNQGVSHSQGLSQGVNVSNSQSVSQGTSYNVSQGQSVGQSHSVGQSENLGYNQSNSASTSHSYGSSSNYSHGVSSGTSDGYSNSTSQSASSSSSLSNSLSHSDSVGNSYSTSSGNSVNGGASGSIGGGYIPASFGVNGGIGHSSSTSNGTSASSSDSYGQSVGSSVGQTVGSSSGHTMSTNSGSSASAGMGYSESAGYSSGTSFGSSHSYGTSESYGTSQSQSLSQGWGANSSESVSQSIGRNVSSSESLGTSQSMGTSQSLGQNYGQSVSQGTGLSYGQSSSVSASTSASDSVSRSLSQSESVSSTESYGQTYGRSASESSSESASTGYGQTIGSSESTSNGSSSSESSGTTSGTSLGSSGTTSFGTSSSMGLGPSLGFSRSNQWKDQAVEDLLELLSYQNERLKLADRGAGAFYTYAYVACASEEGLSSMNTVAKTTWQNNDSMVQPLQVLDLEETESAHLQNHMIAFSTDVTRTRENGVDELKYGTVLLPGEYAAYTHLPRVGEGGVMTTVQDIPKFACNSMMKGDIYMGNIMNPFRWTFDHGYNTPYEYRLDESMLMHGYFTGASRSGKTVAAMRFVASLANIRRKNTGKKLRIVIMDPKRDWRALGRIIEPSRFHYYSMSNPNFHPLHLNIWIVPRHVAPQTWIDCLGDIFCRAFGLSILGLEMFKDAVYPLYTEAGIFTPEGDVLTDPDEIHERSRKVTFVNVYRNMLNQRDVKVATQKIGKQELDNFSRMLSRMGVFGPNKKASIEQRLYGGERELPDGEKWMGIDELIGDDDITVLESQDIDNVFKNFIFGAITAGFFRYARAHDGGFLADDQYETVLVLEEANEILIGSDTGQSNGGNNIGPPGQSEFETMIDQAAGYGLFTICITQTISRLPTAVIANAGLTFIGRLAMEDDVNIAVQRCARDPRIDDRDYVKWFRRAPVGQLVCQATRGRDFKEIEPSLVAIKPIDLQPMSDAELDSVLIRNILYS